MGTRAKAHGAGALAAARCAWGAGGSNGHRPFVPEMVPAGRKKRRATEGEPVSVGTGRRCRGYARHGLERRFSKFGLIPEWNQP